MTNGHLDLIKRASKLFDEVIVGVAINRDKNYFLSQSEKVELIRECCKNMPNVTVSPFDGLIVNALNACKAQAILRGLRAFSDFEYELQMALMNRSLDRKCETIFYDADPEKLFCQFKHRERSGTTRSRFLAICPGTGFRTYYPEAQG